MSAQAVIANANFKFPVNLNCQLEILVILAMQRPRPSIDTSGKVEARTQLSFNIRLLRLKVQTRATGAPAILRKLHLF